MLSRTFFVNKIGELSIFSFENRNIRANEHMIQIGIKIDKLFEDADGSE